jgi:hypothetical protein
MSATKSTPSDSSNTAGRSSSVSKNSFGVLSNNLFRSAETKYILSNVTQVQSWSKFTQRWMFHAPRNPVGYYTNAKIDQKIANISYGLCVLASISVLAACAVDDYRRRQKGMNVDIRLSEITWDNSALACVSLCTALMVCLNLARRYYRGLSMHLALHLTKDRPFQPNKYWKNVMLGGFLSYHHLFELFVILPHMPPFLSASFKYQTEAAGRSINVTYELASFFTLFVIVRMYYLVVAMQDAMLADISPARRLVEINTGMSADGTFLLKLAWNKRFFLFLLLFASSICLISSFYLMVLEGQTKDSSFKEYADCLWFILVTFATIGYGDLAPKTIVGRTIGVVAVLTGLSFSALITARLTDFLNLDAQQFHAKNMLWSEMWENKVINAAVVVIQRKFRYYRSSGLRSVFERRKVSKAIKEWVTTRQDAAMWKASQFHETEFIEKSAQVLNSIVSDLRKVARKSGISKRTLKSKGIDFDDRESDNGVCFHHCFCRLRVIYTLQNSTIQAVLLELRALHLVRRWLIDRNATQPRVTLYLSHAYVRACTSFHTRHL